MKKNKLKKKHAKLYHAETVPYLAAALKAAAARNGYSLIGFADVAAPGDWWAVLSEAVIMALQLSEKQDAFATAQRDGQAEFEAECRKAQAEAPDPEDDFQDFLRAYDMPARLIRMLRVAYLVGAGDAQTSEM